jgi:dihydrofolate synthase/folylpolyglutamate synthase
MRGAHQAANAAVALAVIGELRHQGWCVSSEAMRLGLAQAALPGRVEVVSGEPMVVLDTAHNPASARALIEALAELPRAERRTLVLSISRDKDVRAIVRELVPHFDRFIVTQYQENPRAVAAAKLAQLVHEALGTRGAEVVVYRTPQEAWNYVVPTALRGELVCIAGSFYLTAEMRRLVMNSLRPAPIGIE